MNYWCLDAWMWHFVQYSNLNIYWAKWTSGIFLWNQWLLNWRIETISVPLYKMVSFLIINNSIQISSENNDIHFCAKLFSCFYTFEYVSNNSHSYLVSPWISHSLKHSKMSNWRCYDYVEIFRTFFKNHLYDSIKIYEIFD